MFTDESIIHEFVVESLDMIDQIEPKLIEISNKPQGDTSDSDTIHTVFRLFHSMKGSAGFMNLKTVQRVTHETETFLDLVRNGRIQLTNAHINLLFRVCDFLRILLDRVESTLHDEGAEGEATVFVEELRDATASGAAAFDMQSSMAAAAQEVPPPVTAPAAAKAQDNQDLQDLFDSVMRQSAQPSEVQSDELLSQVINPEMVNHFLKESVELLDQSEQDLLVLEKSPAALENIGDTFRHVHSFKGNCGMLGFSDLERLSHKMENLLELIKDGVMRPEKTNIGLLLSFIDILRGGLNDIAKGGAGHIAGLSTLVELIDEVLPKHTPSPSPAQKRVPVESKSPPVLKVVASQTKGGAMNIPNDLDVNLPQGPQGGGASPGRKVSSSLFLAKGPLTRQASAQPQPVHVPGIPAAVAAARSRVASAAMAAPQERPAPQVRPQSRPVMAAAPVPAPSVGQQAPAGVVASMMQNKAAPMPQAAPVPQAPLTPPQAPQARRESAPLTVGEAQALAERQAVMNRKDIRVDLEKLDVLVDLVGELIIAVSMVSQNPDLEGHQFERFDQAAGHLGKITREIQDISMSLRMVPLSTVFRKMIRLVHDLSTKVNKEVDLVLRGEETEVDKTVIELISDPLVHMIRNSVDHGIEAPAERLAAGKPAKGTVSIEARYEGGEVWVIVKDDGRGLNRQKLLTKGIERGLVKGDGADMKDEDVFRLIFEPGFSTANQVTDVSGRGVGMDVVRKNLERIKGRIDIHSVEGQGTRFILRIPLTLAIIEGMLIRVGERRYIIPMSTIRESIMIKSEDITETLDGQEIIMLRGQLYPVVRLHELHHITPVHTKLEDGLLIVLEHQGTTFCLFVDELLGQLQTVIKGLAGVLGKVRGVSGCAILGDGDVSLILDVSSLVEMASLQEIKESLVN